MFKKKNSVKVSLPINPKKKIYEKTNLKIYNKSFLDEVRKKETTIECASGNDKEVISRARFKPNNHLLAMLHLSFCDHVPMILTPDDIWLTLLQGFSTHININAEKYRTRFTQSSEKETIRVRHDGLVKGGTDSPWHEVFPMFSNVLKEKLGEELHGFLVKGFSTTTPVVENAYNIMLMDVVKSYYDYRVMTMCGIPEIHIEGTLEDWEGLYDRVSKFEEFDLGWWSEKLRYVLGNIVKTVKSKGKKDKKFWQSFYKFKSFSGGDVATGWVNILFPYDKNEKLNPYCKNYDPNKKEDKNRFGGDGLNLGQYPSGLSKVPFIWEYFSQKFDMDFFSGFTGLLQEERDNGALRTNIGWAVAYQGGQELEEKRHHW
ncbi:hypothetical protein M0812_15628 [Anaeramoeba flamelloides]|uniref:DUF4419 domain-containing protein n=1 Tax=Anaeramoeba flamelloides TaxID=1746091 RepID=A0AAV7ZEF3_9EUKA|nr:hypothetical protein M0812_15628 [Anaeramoeba flamelloides]